jgi:hypothetical protein
MDAMTVPKLTPHPCTEPVPRGPMCIPGGHLYLSPPLPHRVYKGPSQGPKLTPRPESEGRTSTEKRRKGNPARPSSLERSPVPAKSTALEPQGRAAAVAGNRSAPLHGAESSTHLRPRRALEVAR